MKEKSSIEKKAEEKQIDLLSKALNEASNAGGHWLNASGKKFPRLYPQGVSASPFNALFMALHSDRYGCKTNLFTLYTDAKARGTAVREHEQAYRRQGIASALTSRLTLEILALGKVPFYCAAWSNIRSVRNALHCGFSPAWAEISSRSAAFIDQLNNE